MPRLTQLTQLSRPLRTGGYFGARAVPAATLAQLRAISGLVGYWPSSADYLYEDSAGYTPASVSGVVGQRRDISGSTVPVARRNLLTYSEQFDNAVWVKTASSITPNATLAPDGNQAAALYIPNTGTTGTQNAIYRSGVSTSAPMAGSLCVKSAGVRYLMFGPYSQTIFDFRYSIFDTTNGVWLNTTNYSNAAFYASSLGGGWFRVSYTINSLDAAFNNFYLRATAGPTYADKNTVIGDGTSGIYIWGAQLELGADATPYQKIVTGTGDTFLPGNHAYQQTTSKKPILRAVTSPNGYWCDGDADDALNVTLPNDLGSSCTVVRATAAGVTFTEGQEITSPYNLLNAYDADDLTRYSGDVAIFNRALTTAEKSIVASYLARGVPTLTNGSLV